MELKKVIFGTDRYSVLDIMTRHGGNGLELGVAEGSFSRHMVESCRFSKFFGVDAYNDIHDTKEYIDAITNVGLGKSYWLFRMSFQDALEVFPVDYFDFIYVDGYAHTGQQGGKTFVDWWPYLKVGGILAGDDYHTDWPLVQMAVDSVAAQNGGTLYLTPCASNGTDAYSRYPSFFVVKQAGVDKLSMPRHLSELARAAEEVHSENRNSNIWKVKWRLRRAVNRLYRTFWS